MCIFQIYPITKALKEHKYVLIVLPFVLFGSRFFGFEQRCPPDDSGIHVYIRQSIHCWQKAMALYSFILLGATIHQSAYMLIPFYFIADRITIADKRKMMLVFFTCCFVAGQTPAFQNLAEYVSDLPLSLGMEDTQNALPYSSCKVKRMKLWLLVRWCSLICWLPILQFGLGLF